MMFFSPEFSQKYDTPCLFLHGLGSQTSLAPEMQKTLSDIGLDVSSVLRNDQMILKEDNSQEIFEREISSLILELAQASGKKVLLLGNSLGSYIALLAGLKVSDSVQALLGLDAFFTPRHGFSYMKARSEDLERQIQPIAYSQLSEFGKRYKEETASKGENTFIVPLVDGFIELPNTIASNLQDIGELSRSQNIPFPVGLVYAKYDEFILEDKKPDTLILGNDISGFEISHISNSQGDEKKAGHNDWKKSPEAIQFAIDFLRKNIPAVK